MKTSDAELEISSVPPLLTDVRHDTPFILDDGSVAYTRAAVVEDYPLVEDLHARCSAASLVGRYGARRPGFSAAEWRRMADSPRSRVLLVTPDQSDRVVAMASMVERSNAPEVCDVAMLVADRSPDAYQSRGLGTRLADLAADLARDTGFKSLAVTSLWTNWRMLLIVEHLGGPVLPQTSYVRNMAMLGLLPNSGLDVADEIELRIEL
ncbi:GNAT family N-acetyltransferase [Streptomyces canus]|uniref:GNAT family N-acetyltransferase n=1 Tax=Streptomyces canus TaxID=58343 RepID=UPI0027897C69|nr:GNAT family N-acetyltransferase [Streptomyces canus]MDQ0765662.1 GNAT superfamily N-acetyltransferase [Streptomyces canus]